MRETFAAHPWEGREVAPLRRQAAPGFTPQMLDACRPVIRGLATRLVRRGGQDRMDVVRAVCAPLPALVLAEVFAVPERDREPFLAWSSQLADFHSPAADANRGDRRGPPWGPRGACSPGSPPCSRSGAGHPARICSAGCSRSSSRARAPRCSGCPRSPCSSSASSGS
ncbi:hypothetical protein ACN28S_61955 [Cystobacter fuscus]